MKKKCKKNFFRSFFFILLSNYYKFRSFEYFSVESAHNGFNGRVNVAAIVEKLNFRAFKPSKTDVLNRQWIFLEHGDYWL